MTSRYNRQADGGQPPGAPARRGAAARPDAGSAACAHLAAADLASARDDERALRERALRLALAGRAAFAGALELELAELASTCRASTVAVMVATAAGMGPPAVRLASCWPPGGADGLADLAARRPWPGTDRPAALEFPPCGAPARDATALARERGVQALRWAIHPLGPPGPGSAQAHLVLVAESRDRRVYWTPSMRRLHDGTAAVLAELGTRLAGAGTNGRSPAAPHLRAQR